MAVPPGQGNADHTHEVEEVFFVLKGHLTVFVEDENWTSLWIRCWGHGIASPCPAGVIHGYQNNTVDMVFSQRHGRGRGQARSHGLYPIPSCSSAARNTSRRRRATRQADVIGTDLLVTRGQKSSKA